MQSLELLPFPHSQCDASKLVFLKQLPNLCCLILSDEDEELDELQIDALIPPSRTLPKLKHFKYNDTDYYA